MENILTIQKEPNFVNSIIKAIVAGYSDNQIIDSIDDLIRKKQASKGILVSSPEALRSYSSQISQSLEIIAEKIEEFSNNSNKIVFASNKIEIDEDWELYKYDQETNKISGLLKINFNQDMTNMIKEAKIELNADQIKEITLKVFDYFRNEYKNLKANLNDDIFKGNIRFADLDSGQAYVKYEIENAFEV